MLCRERLERIQRVLNKCGGVLPIRTFARTYSVWPWELEQAAALGWIEFSVRKPATGRPSRMVKSVSKPEAAKLPPWRCQIEKPISIRHQFFALHSSLGAVKGGIKKLVFMPPWTSAYQKAFPGARKRRAAAASMSRLMKRYDVRIARAWYYSLMDGDVPRGESMPSTVTAILQRLREVNSRRIRW